MEVKTPFDGLMSFSDASELWGLSESTLRKAVAYGKRKPARLGRQTSLVRSAHVLGVRVG